MPAAKIDFSEVKNVIKLLLISDKDINWPKEVRIAKKLLGLYPFLKNWNSFEIPNKPKSLPFYLTKEGKEAIIKEHQRRDFDLKEKIENTVGKEILGESFSYIKKPKTIIEFIS